MATLNKKQKNENEDVASITLTASGTELYRVEIPMEKLRMVMQIAGQLMSNDESDYEGEGKAEHGVVVGEGMFTATTTTKQASSSTESKVSKNAELVRDVRQQRGLSQMALAKKINLDQTQVSAIERGKRRVNKELAKALGKALGKNYKIFLDEHHV